MLNVSTLGASIGLTLSIFLIFRKLNPFYAMIFGALIGGIIGGANLCDTINIIIGGSQSIIPAIMRILAAGIFAGVLIETGAADKIADTIISTLGEHMALLAIIIASTIICSVGVVVPVAVITVAPVALLLGNKCGISKNSILLAMLGGAKSGNIMSPNPSTIVIADSFHVDLSLVMLNGFIPALFGVIMTYIMANKISHKGQKITISSNEINKKNMPSFLKAITGPISIIILLTLNSILNLKMDSMIILPLGGLIGTICIGKLDKFMDYCTAGLNKMTGAAILLLGTGAISGLISNSNLSSSIMYIIKQLGVPEIFIASLSALLMGGATASITGGSVVTSNVFSNQILHTGVNPLGAAEMVNTGVSVFDDLPHGNLFHISAKSVELEIKERAKLIPYEILIGLTMNVSATILFCFFKS